MPMENQLIDGTTELELRQEKATAGDFAAFQRLLVNLQVRIVGQQLRARTER